MSEKISIDGRTYFVDEMNEDQTNLLNGLQFAENMINQLNSQIGVYQEGKEALVLKLKNSLEND